MRKDRKLDVLLKKTEMVVQEAACYLRDVETVVEQRRQSYEELQGSKKRLVEKLRDTRGSGRLKALQAGDVLGVSAMTCYLTRLTQQIARFERMLERDIEDLKRAKQRAELAHRELLEARIEKSKIEQVIKKRKKSEYITSVAREDDMFDEMNALFAKSKG